MPATPKTDPLPDDEVTPAEAQEREVEAEEAGHYVPASLAGKDVRIVPAGAWRMSWQRLAMEGNFDAFAAKVFHPDDLELYFEIDPTLSEFNEFMSDVAMGVGEPLGKSGGPHPSSRSTRRR